MKVKEAIAIAITELHNQHFPNNPGEKVECLSSNCEYDEFDIIEGHEREWIDRVKSQMKLTFVERDNKP